MEASRLGIPLLLGFDVIHGHRTIFPLPLAQAASWDPEVAETVSRVAAAEASAEGIRWVFAPMVDIARDPRWGRFEECYGEDPYLVSRIGLAAVYGLQGRGPTIDAQHVAVTLKHFAV